MLLLKICILLFHASFKLMYHIYQLTYHINSCQFNSCALSTHVSYKITYPINSFTQLTLVSYQNSYPINSCTSSFINSCILQLSYPINSCTFINSSILPSHISYQLMYFYQLVYPTTIHIL